jgi:hypothetical protein
MLPRHTNSTPILSLITTPVVVEPVPSTRACARRQRTRVHCRRTVSAFPSAIVFAAIALAAGCGDGTTQADLCTDVTRVATLPDVLDEASGVTFSRAQDGVLWVHNDSEGTPSLYAIDLGGALLAEIELPDAATQSDWEAIAAGPCPAGDCLYIGDIGDNLHNRDDRAILRVPEPQPRSGSAGPVERFPIRYPDGPQDAEALFVLPDTTVFIISKGRNGPITVYRYPPPFRPGERVMLEPVQRLTEGIAQLPHLVTGAAATPDGQVVAVRSYSHLQLYRLAGDTLEALWPAPGFDLAPLSEPQGEGVTIAADGTVYLVSETGPERLPPPLSRLRCRLP